MQCEVTDLCTLKKQINNEASLRLPEVVVVESPVELREDKMQDQFQQ
jgi:hypothetical protein